MNILKAMVAVALASLAGCSGTSQVQALDGDAISAVQAELKRQVGVYLRAANQDPFFIKDDKMILVTRPKEAFLCGLGHLEYDISKINAELTTTDTNTVGGGLTFTVPVQMVTIGGGAGISKEVSNTQILKYNVWPLALEDQEDAFRRLGSPTWDDIKAAPIAQALLNLRNRQIFGAMITNPVTGQLNANPQPCFSAANPHKPLDGTENTYSLGLTTTLDASGKASVSLAVVGANIAGEHKSVTGNTLLVSFQPAGLDKLQIEVDAATKACAGALSKTTNCKSMQDIALKHLRNYDVILRNPKLLDLPQIFDQPPAK